VISQDAAMQATAIMFDAEENNYLLINQANN
jgi:hypothetical protein